MTRQSELKRRFDPEIGRYVKKHIHSGEIHGEGLMDIFKSVGSRLFGKTAKEIAKKAATTAATKAATKTGEHLGNKAGDRIIQLLSKKHPPQQTISKAAERPMTDFEIAQRVNQLISGGKIRKR